MEFVQRALEYAVAVSDWYQNKSDKQNDNGTLFCVVVSLNCDEASSSNNTYISQEMTSSSGICTYRICKSDKNICRIRLDFNVSDLSIIIGKGITSSSIS